MQGFHEGYAYFQKNAGVCDATAKSADYVDRINAAIDKLVNDINGFKDYKTDTDKLQGDLAEFWHADTFNIRAVMQGSEHRAFIKRSYDYASTDISTNFGDSYGLKYYKNGVESAKAQAKSVFERFKEYQATGGKDSIDKYLEDRGFSDIESVLHDPLKKKKKRIIPMDQVQAAADWLRRKIKVSSVIHPEQVKRYQDTLNFLTDRIKDNEGVESIVLSREESNKLAELGKQGNLDASELGLTTEELVTYEFILKQAFKAGLTTATISFVLKVAPEIIKAINYLIQNGKIDKEQYISLGFSALSGYSEGFIRGTISASITTACKTGLLGEAAKTINPSIIGMAVILVMDTMKNAFSVATGNMSRKQMADSLIKETFIASISLLSGTAGQILLPSLPVAGFMLGSFVGSVAGGIIYSSGYSIAISFCIDTGFTMFGLVEQNYNLSEDLIKEIGISVFDVSRFKPSLIEETKFEPSRFEAARVQIKTFRPFFLRRGVIGIREIGYI